MYRLLLVSVATDAGADNFSAIAALADFSKKSLMAPVPLATLAALTPGNFDIEIWDEAVRGPIGPHHRLDCYDIVGVTGYQAHLTAAKRVARIANAQNRLTVVGGPGASSAPENYRDDFDVVFVGEAEHTWPRFLAEWQTGTHTGEYRQIVKPDLADSPVPEWSAVASEMDSYFLGGVQTTRGCPFDCEFCDVIFLYGRKPRHKPVEQVLTEVRNLEKLGVTGIFFCDDNLIGNPAYAKKLLRALIPVNNAFGQPLGFSTQITINVAKDDALLALLADANFDTLYIGVETPEKDSLREANKPQNVASDLVADISHIHSYGIPVRAGMIVGFDNDDKSVFDKQFRFLRQAGVPVVTVNMLKAPVGTKVWTRLRAEERVISAAAGISDEVDSMRYSQTNVIPKQMTRSDLMKGQMRLMGRLCDWKNFADRVELFVSQARRQPNIAAKPYSPHAVIKALEGLLEALADQPEAQQQVIRLMFFTRLRAPGLISRVFGLILQQIGVAGMLAELSGESEAQIARELAVEDLDALIDRSPILLSGAFRDDFPAIFPQLLAHLRGAITDETRLPAAICEVVKDFLIRWGNTYDGLKPHHLVEMTEIADRLVARLPADGTRFSPGETIGDIRAISQLRREVLKVVERDLRGLTAGAGA